LKKRSGKHDLLKLIGIWAMLLDHIGWVIFPHHTILRIIGRLALPIFCAGIALGYQRTSNFKKYFFQLLLFGLISQIPYNLLWNTHKINIILALVLSLFLIYLVDKKRYLWSVGIFWLSTVLFIEYSWYAPTIALIFFKFKDQKKIAFVLLFLATFGYIQQTSASIQWYALIGFFIVLFMPEIKLNFKLNKYIFYFFYPLHLLILYLILRWI